MGEVTSDGDSWSGPIRLGQGDGGVATTENGRLQVARPLQGTGSGEQVQLDGKGKNVRGCCKGGKAGVRLHKG